MPVNALNNTSTKFEEVYLETSPTPTGGSSVIRRRAFSVPTLTVDTTDITYFLTLDPVDIKGSYAVMVKGSLNPKDINPTYKYSYLFEIYTCFNLNWAINSYPTTSDPTSGYFFNSLIIKNQTTEIQNVPANPLFELLSPSEDNIVELNPSSDTINPDIRFGLNFDPSAFGDWIVSGMVYSF